MNRSKTAVMMLSILCAGALLGVLAAVQLKNVRLAGGLVSQDRTAQLQQQLDTLRDQKTDLAGQLAALQASLGSISNDLAKEQEALADTQKAVLDARRAAGLTDVAGPGIVVTINPQTYTEGGKRKIVKDITDSELLTLVNELDAAGAEAISINGHRLVATSAIRMAGAHININHVATDMPYEIRVIGDPDTLEAALQLYGGVLESLNEFYVVKVDKQTAITIGAYEGKQGFAYAQPVTAQ